jgi:hypothetical protein
MLRLEDGRLFQGRIGGALGLQSRLVLLRQSLFRSLMLGMYASVMK